MCQDCHSGFGEDRQREFLRRYLTDLEAMVERNPTDEAAVETANRTRELLEAMEEAR